jgi:hypothetical protein
MLKSTIALVALLAGMASVRAQSSSADLVAWRIVNDLKGHIELVKSANANEVQHGNLLVSGILVQLVKTDNPLQMVNPAAPPEYGPAEQNVFRDPVSGRTTGLKFLSVNF